MEKQANPFARIFGRAAPAVGRGLRAARGPALGVAGGAGGLYGLQQYGQQQLANQQEAQEMQQLLQAYPELLYSMPGAPGTEMGMMDPYAQQQMPYEQMVGYGYY